MYPLAKIVLLASCIFYNLINLKHLFLHSICVIYVSLILWFTVLCLAGFGNLPGDMVSKFKLIIL